jgi:hypothetical protein
MIQHQKIEKQVIDSYVAYFIFKLKTIFWIYNPNNYILIFELIYVLK